jgi:methionyl aminopeptidase
MSITKPEELEGLQEAAAVVRLVLDAMKSRVEPGITTAELDSIGANVMRSNHAKSAPAKVYGFPGNCCISVNDEAVHGIPKRRALKEGDLLKIDVTVEKNGYMADAAVTVPVGHVTSRRQWLIDCAEEAFRSALLVARAGNRVCEIGRTIEATVVDQGFSVIRELGGHGIGRTIHEEPRVPNFYDRSANQILVEGMVITVEPIIAGGQGEAVWDSDGWTIRTADRSPSAHYEHTIVITAELPLILTAA